MSQTPSKPKKSLEEVVVKIPTTHNDTLEGRMIVAEATSLYSELGVILCHPMPLLGGNLDNNVVTAIYFTCASKLRCSTLRFNFRGVGASTGNYFREKRKRSISTTIYKVFNAQDVDRGVEKRNAMTS
jgi:hypothetical protein